MTTEGIVNEPKTLQEEDPDREVWAQREALQKQLDALTTTILSIANRTCRTTDEWRERRAAYEAPLRELHTVQQMMQTLINQSYIEATDRMNAGDACYWPTEHPERLRKVVMHSEGGRTMPAIVGKKGAFSRPLSEGDLVVAPIWDHDVLISPDVPRKHTESYLAARCAHELALLNDRVWALEEICAEYNESSPTREAYIALLERDREPSGIIAERMVKSVFAKLCHDANLGFAYKEVSLRDDMDSKTDFILHINGTMRTAGTTTTPQGVDVRVQFTLDKDKRERKHQQLARVAWEEKRTANEEETPSTHVLVVMPFEHIADLHEQWVAQDHRQPGGPESLWSIEQVEEVFRGVLKEIPTDDLDVDAEWEKARTCFKQPTPS